MRFDRGLRSATLKPYPVGYAALATDSFNGEDPHCQFGGVKDAGSWLVEQMFPSVIELHVHLTPIWLENRTATAKFDRSTYCQVYSARNVFSHVRVTFQGTGNYQKISGQENIPFLGVQFSDYVLELPGPHLYVKTFCVQPEGRAISWHLQDKGTRSEHVLWAFGGLQVEDDIQPFVFTLDTLRDETIILPTSLLNWREQGLVSSPEILFQDTWQPDEQRTLRESLEAGMSVIYLKLGVDENGENLKIPYSSYRLANGYLFYKRGK
ncbi:MAG: hypothetical protein FJX71_00450 [Alphaproteobacteria bacterium]|nr:hypothetical protein [Alphaproteobacteria bacterium]